MSNARSDEAEVKVRVIFLGLELKLAPRNLKVDEWSVKAAHIFYSLSFYQIIFLNTFKISGKFCGIRIIFNAGIYTHPRQHQATITYVVSEASAEEIKSLDTMTTMHAWLPHYHFWCATPYSQSRDGATSQEKFLLSRKPHSGEALLFWAAFIPDLEMRHFSACELFAINLPRTWPPHSS